MFTEYINESRPGLIGLIRSLCAIPAPSTMEDARARFCADWLQKNGATSVYIDDAKNVVLPIGCDGSREITVIVAHTDTVFPDTTPLPFDEDDEKIYSPGVGDNTASLAVMMYTAKYLIQNNIKPPRGILFVCNSCEEGLGNLRGTREIFKSFSGRIKNFISFDSQIGIINKDCVGSRRFEVEVRTEGGHSFGNFGNPNAIYELGKIIERIYSIKPPQINGSKTTYNVGHIEGGTSVNSIAQNAKMLCEYRSDNVECMALMQKKFDEIFSEADTSGVSVSVREIGYRPCADGVDRDALSALSSLCASATEQVTHKDVIYSPSSTDCNIPLSIGIPAVCIGVCLSHGAHTREEYLIKSSIPVGLDIALRTVTALIG